MAFTLSFKNFIYDKRIAILLWFGLSLIGVILESQKSSGNNFLIFKGVDSFFLNVSQSIDHNSS